MKTRTFALLWVALCAVIFTATASAAVTALPNDPLTGFPRAYQDTGSNFAVGLCMDGVANRCIGAPVPHPADPYMVPENFTPDGEAFWWRADAAFPPPFDKALVEFAQEAAFGGPAGDIVAGDQVAFSRIRFARFPISGPAALKANTWYRFTHPYGIDEVQTDALAQVRFTEDSGCLLPPCNFAAAPQGRVTSFLRWDPSVAPAPPAGYIGDPLVEHAVIGGPDGDAVTVEEISGKGGSVVKLITQTDQFFVMGKLAGPPPPPAPFALIPATALSFEAREVEDGSAPVQSFTIKNRGDAPLTITGATMSGAAAADFGADISGCAAGVAPGATCEVRVGFLPTAVGPRAGVLTVTHTARNSPKAITLTGTGNVQHVLSIPGVRFAKGYGRNGKGGFSLAKFKSKGVDLVLTLDPATAVIRLRVLRELPPRTPGGKPRFKIMMTEFVTPKVGANGTFRITYKPPALIAAAGKGEYRVQIVPARRSLVLGIATKLDFAIDHK